MNVADEGAWELTDFLDQGMVCHELNHQLFACCFPGHLVSSIQPILLLLLAEFTSEQRRQTVCIIKVDSTIG